MEQLKIKSGNQSIVVQSEDISILKEIKSSDFLKKYIPDVAIEVFKSYQKKQLTFTLRESSLVSFSFDEHEAILSGTLGENLNIRDIISTIDYVLDYARQTKGEYNIHGSSAAYEDQGILIVGSVSGLGKTSLNLNLCLNHGCSFIGDEKLLITSELKILGGAKMLEFNKPGLYKYFSIAINNSDISELNRHFTIKKESADLKIIIQPMIFEGASLDVEEWPIEKTEWHIYEELTRKIRGLSRRISNFSYPLQSIDNEEISIKRIQTAKKVATHIKGYCLRGGVEEVSHYIINLLK